MKNKLNLLLVDDSQRILDQLQEMLGEQKGVGTVHTAQDAPSALTMMKANDYDVVVLDIQLPDANGIDVLKWIKHMNPDMCVVMFSNLSDECHRAAARMAGADHFFDKSNEYDEIPRVLALL